MTHAADDIDDMSMTAHPYAPTYTPQHPCPICGRNFTHSRERHHHLLSFMQHWIYCPSPCFSYRCECPDSLINQWQKKHANSRFNSGQTPQQQQVRIYDLDSLVTRKTANGGQMSMELAVDIALSGVEKRAPELPVSKEDV